MSECVLVDSSTNCLFALLCSTSWVLRTITATTAELCGVILKISPENNNNKNWCFSSGSSSSDDSSGGGGGTLVSHHQLLNIFSLLVVVEVVLGKMCAPDFGFG